MNYGLFITVAASFLAFNRKDLGVLLLRPSSCACSFNRAPLAFKTGPQ